jgi:predicted ester cyclase
MSLEANKALVRHYLDEIYRGNLDILDEVVSEEYDDHANPPPPGVTVVEDSRQGFGGLRRAFPDIRIRFEEIIAEDDWVALHCVLDGTHLGAWRGIPPTGKHTIWTCTAFRRVGDGKLVEGYATFDWPGVMQQLGVTVMPPDPAAS